MSEIENAYLNRSSICLILRNVDGEVYQWKRLKIGIYALTKNMPDTKKENESMIFNYKFKDLCYEGMTDRRELVRDMDILEHNNYIDRIRVKKEGSMTDHDLIKLLPEGEELADEAELLLTGTQINKLNEITQTLKDENILAEDLLFKYGKNWSKENVKYLIKSFKNQ
ncbi:MAG: hypothetical protein GF329_09745 [Candidatus Lokiarchaeota archaeon]|nr:hypothetical protein [Candidatus Lokiarchaeota archaeon]